MVFCCVLCFFCGLICVFVCAVWFWYSRFMVGLVLFAFPSLVVFVLKLLCLGFVMFGLLLF